MRGGAEKRPTIGLSEIGSVARACDAVEGRRGGNLANWKTGILGTARVEALAQPSRTVIPLVVA